MTDNTLEDFQLQDEWSKQNKVSPRTTARYRTRCGLPWLEFGGRIYIHKSGAKEWIAKRIKRTPEKRGR